MPGICTEHQAIATGLIDVDRKVSELNGIVRNQMIPQQAKILAALNGSQDSLATRLTRVEAGGTDHHGSIEEVKVLLRGQDGNGGLTGRVGKLERMWAYVAGGIAVGGTAAVGMIKVLSHLLG